MRKGGGDLLLKTHENTKRKKKKTNLKKWGGFKGKEI
jgi:hypothetical protein